MEQHSFESGPRPADQSVSKNRDQAEFEISFFGRILERLPAYVEVLRRQAELLSTSGRRSEGLACDALLARLLPDDAEVRYNLACSQASLGKADEAIDTLGQAIELGYRDIDHLESDPDLDSLRDHPRYLELLRLHLSDDVA